MNHYKGEGKKTIPHDIKRGRVNKRGYTFYGTIGIADALRKAK
jgi:hypothetical protein